MSYRYYFTDGYICHLSYRMSKTEIKAEELKHGKMFRLVYVKQKGGDYMVINMCDYPTKKANNLIENFGGHITRYNNGGLCDICFENFTMEVHDVYVIIRNPKAQNTEDRLVINYREFSTIYIH